MDWNLMRTCAIVGASDFNADAFSGLDAEGAFDFVIAADGGYAHLEALGRKVDLVVGDFDSLGYRPAGVRKAVYSPYKDKSDVEIAVEHARKRDCDCLVVFGALGGRLDHTLANMQVMAHASEEGMRVCMIGATEEIRFVTGPDALAIPARAEGAVSVFSMCDCARGVFERGLEWELYDAELSSRTSLGLSNRFKGDPVLIGVDEGTIAVVMGL